MFRIATSTLKFLTSQGPGRQTGAGVHIAAVAVMIFITEGVALGEGELEFAASRSSGPGGQNVNKVNSRIAVLFDVAASPSLDPVQREKILTRLKTRISREGVLQVVSQKHRTQSANREAALARMIELIRDALTDAPPRRKTKVPRRVKESRLEDKRVRSRIKKERKGEE